MNGMSENTIKTLFITGRITSDLTISYIYQYLRNGTVRVYIDIELTYFQYINIRLSNIAVSFNG